MFWRRPSRVIAPGVLLIASRSSAATWACGTTLIWLADPPSTASNAARPPGTRPGGGTHQASDPSPALAFLALPHLRERDRVGLLVAAGDEGRHAADRVCSSAVAGIDQQFGVRA